MQKYYIYLSSCRKYVKSRDVVLTKRCGNAPKKLVILKQFQTHFKAKPEKSVGMPFPPHYIPD